MPFGWRTTAPLYPDPSPRSRHATDRGVGSDGARADVARPPALSFAGRVDAPGGDPRLDVLGPVPHKATQSNEREAEPTADPVLLER